MPFINKYECNKCKLSFPEGWGGYMYVIDNNGKRICCPHPSERRKVSEVLGNGASQNLIEARTGFNADCICQDCLKQFVLDIGDDEKAVESWRYRYDSYLGLVKHGFIIRRDDRKCPYCKSKDVKTVMELVGQPCPKCREGTIEEISTGLQS